MNPTAPTNPPKPGTSARSWWVLVGVLVLVVGSSRAWGWWQDQLTARLIKEQVQAHDITIYTTSTCPYCAQARAWLDAHEIPWRECNIELNALCQQTFEIKGSPGVPLVRVRDQWHVGFSASWLAQALRNVPPSPPGNQAAATSPSDSNAPRP